MFDRTFNIQVYISDACYKISAGSFHFGRFGAGVVELIHSRIFESINDSDSPYFRVNPFRFRFTQYLN